jgi:putative ribosome biogenesis GTPase RsgA
MAQGILLDKSNVLEVKVEDNYYRVSYGFHEFARLSRVCKFSQR